MLRKQTAHLNLTGGLQKKDDEFLVIPSKLVGADNVQFDDASTVIRRGGQSSLSFGAFASGQARRAFSHKGVAVFEKDGHLVRAGAGGVSQVLNQATVDGFTPARAAPRAGMTTQRIAGVLTKGSAYAAGVPFYDGSYDCASIGNVTCYVYETRNSATGRQTVRVVVVDDANSGFPIYESTLSDSTNVIVKPRVVANASKFFVFVGSFASGGTTFDIKSLTITAAGSASALTAVITSVAGIGGTVEGTANDAILFDVAFSPAFGHLGMVCRITAGTTGHYDIDTSDGFTILASGSSTPSATLRSITALFTSNVDDEVVLHAFYGINTNVAKGAGYDFTNTTTVAETTVGTGAVGSTVWRLAAYENSTTQVYLAFDCVDANGQSRLRLSRFTHTYGSLTECASLSPWFIAGRIGAVNSRLYLPMTFLSAEYQNTVFVIDLTTALGNLGVSGAAGEAPHVVARIDYGEVAIDRNKLVISTRVPSMPVRSNSLVLPYLKYESNLRLAGTTNDTAYALTRALIDFDSQLGHEEINGITITAGACPYLYDGSFYVEEGFHHGPEILAVGSPAASGTYTFPNASDTFTFCLTWAWQDSAGNWWESAPSGEKTVTITAGSGNYSITPTVSSPPTQKPGARLLMYRTKGDSTDTTLYLATTYAGAALISDADLDDGEQIYTSGNVLPNTPAPACRHVSTFQKRLVLSGCGDGSRVHWSKVTTPGYGVEFSSGDPTHQTVVPSDKGRVVGTEEMDDFLVVLCENGVGVIGGTGPNDSGTQGQYSDFSSKVTEVGCSWDSPKSIVRGPEGVWFRSPFGIRLFNRSGSLGLASDGKQAGAEVDSLVSGNLVAVTGDAKQQIRFYQSSGTVLVWDYQWKQWSRFTGFANVDAVYADDRYYHVSNVSTTPLLRYTNESVYVDVGDDGLGTAFTARIETPWLSFAGIQGFQRVYRLLVLGKNSAASKQTSFIVRTYLDYEAATVVESVAPTPTATSSGLLQFEHHFSNQKCESMKLEIFFFYVNNTGTEGRLRLTDLSLQLGVKAGFFKVPSSKRY